MPVHYFDENIKSGLQQKRELTHFITRTALKLRPACRKVQLNYIFCTDECLLDKNITYLRHDTLTDVITFDLSETPEQLEAEIYISIERVRENADLFQVAYWEELHRVIFHGLLHLCGFKDKTEEEQQEMRRQEQLCLQQYFH